MRRSALLFHMRADDHGTRTPIQLDQFLRLFLFFHDYVIERYQYLTKVRSVQKETALFDKYKDNHNSPYRISVLYPNFPTTLWMYGSMRVLTILCIQGVPKNSVDQ